MEQWHVSTGSSHDVLGIILDCCRSRLKESGDNGAMPYFSLVGNSYVMYACERGKTAVVGRTNKDPSLFTGHLLRHLDTQRDVVQIARSVTAAVVQDTQDQRPWYEESILSTNEPVTFYGWVCTVNCLLAAPQFYTYTDRPWTRPNQIGRSRLVLIDISSVLQGFVHSNKFYPTVYRFKTLKYDN